MTADDLALDPVRRPRHALRAVVAVVLAFGLVFAVVGAIAVGNPDEQVVQAVETDAAAEVDPLTDPDGPGYERTLSQFAQGDQLRAERDAALAAAAAMAEQEAAAREAAEAAARDAEREAALEAAAAMAAAEEEAAAPAPAPAPAPSPTPNTTPTPPSIDGDPFDALAQCESGRNPAAVNPRGYYGAFQFSLPTWNQYRSGNPIEYSYAEQKAVARQHQAARGWGAWPHCARQLGLL